MDGLKEAEETGLNMVGIELTFDDEGMVSRERMDSWHEKGYFLLTNSLNIGGPSLNAGHDDDISMAGNPAQGWGWLTNQGFDIIQTDHAEQLAKYLRR